jgi:hypothetical protein
MIARDVQPSRRFALFYVSGIAGLIYQVLWLRRCR